MPERRRIRDRLYQRKHHLFRQVLVGRITQAQMDQRLTTILLNLPVAKLREGLR
jgi:hypothetical protein